MRRLRVLRNKRTNAEQRCFTCTLLCAEHEMCYFLLCCPLCRPQVVNAQAHDNMYSRVPVKESKSWELMATAVDQRRQAIPRNVIVATFDPVKCRGASHRQNRVHAPYSFKHRNDINSGSNEPKIRRHNNLAQPSHGTWHGRYDRIVEPVQSKGNYAIASVANQL